MHVYISKWACGGAAAAAAAAPTAAPGVVDLLEPIDSLTHSIPGPRVITDWLEHEDCGAE